jgi:hypothetical protein
MRGHARSTPLLSGTGGATDTYGAPDFHISATASSGLAVSFSAVALAGAKRGLGGALHYVDRRLFA